MLYSPPKHMGVQNRVQRYCKSNKIQNKILFIFILSEILIIQKGSRFLQVTCKSPYS